MIVVEGKMSLEVVAGDIGVIEVTACASAVDGERIRISAVEELVADICMMEVITMVINELASVMLGDTVSSGMSISLISPSPDPNPGPMLAWASTIDFRVTADIINQVAEIKRVILR